MSSGCVTTRKMVVYYLFKVELDATSDVFLISICASRKLCLTVEAIILHS